MGVTLGDITPRNWVECINLRPTPDQTQFVAANAVSLAQSKYQPEMVPLAIYADEIMVGFAMYALDRDDGNYWIYRFMVDERHQRQGYGRAALVALVRRIRALPALAQSADIYLSCDPENAAAQRFYERVGFARTGAIIGGEVGMKLSADHSVE